MRLTTKLTAIGGALAATALLATSCSSSGSPASGSSSKSSSSASMTMSMSPGQSMSSSPSVSSESAAQRATITIKDFKYAVPSAVKPGAKVTVTNEDSQAHTVTADKGSAFDVKIDPGKSATFTAPGSAGSYAFHCTFHSNMHGILKVS
jgi:plastocyanin